MIKTPVNWLTGCCFAHELVDDDGRALAEEECTEACRRINTHDTLVEALEKIADFATYESNFNEDILDIATQALAAAKGGA